jgi:hypothetical protein
MSLRPDIVTFWHGPLDNLRRLCLRSQVAAGHKVTIFSFDPIARLPDGVGNAEAEAILPHSFAERLRPIADGVWIDRTMLQFSDFFRMRLMAKNSGENAGLWLDADVLLLKAIEIDPTQPYFAWEGPHQLGNSVLYLPANDPIVAAFEALMAQDELTPDWLSLRHRLTFMLHKLRGTRRISEVRLAIYGPAALTALARRAGEFILCRARRTKTVLRANEFFAAGPRSRDHRLPYLAKRPRQRSAGAGQPLCLGGRPIRLLRRPHGAWPPTLRHLI